MTGATLYRTSSPEAVHREAHHKLAALQARIARNLGADAAIIEYNTLAKLHAALPHTEHLTTQYHPGVPIR
jgi:hypothetical protein